MTANLNGAVTATVDGEKTVIIGSEDSSSSSVVEITKPDEVVSLIKEEEVDVDDSSSVGFAKPVEGLYEMGPTPFLRKTYDMVNDPETDPILSWSPTRKSFIIWDSYKFSENLLPKYFKHKNFSSFLRQLNTYGFRKVDLGRWEFANEGFQGGKKHLLKSIKRRIKINCNKDGNNAVPESETEVESLKKDQSSMRLELLKLNQRQEESSHEMDTVEDKIQGVESKLQQTISFFEKLAKDQRFAERLMRKRRLRKQQRELEATEFVKKLKLLQDQETQEKLPYVESDLIIGKDMLNAEALIDDGGKSIVVDVNGRDSIIL